MICPSSSPQRSCSSRRQSTRRSARSWTLPSPSSPASRRRVAVPTRRRVGVPTRRRVAVPTRRASPQTAPPSPCTAVPAAGEGERVREQPGGAATKARPRRRRHATPPAPAAPAWRRRVASAALTFLHLIEALAVSCCCCAGTDGDVVVAVAQPRSHRVYIPFSTQVRVVYFGFLYNI